MLRSHTTMTKQTITIIMDPVQGEFHTRGIIQDTTVWKDAVFATPEECQQYLLNTINFERFKVVVFVTKGPI